MLAFINVITNFMLHNQQISKPKSDKNKEDTCLEFIPSNKKKNIIKILKKPMKRNLVHYKVQIVKMKLSYQAWTNKTSIFEIFHKAIRKTLE